MARLIDRIQIFPPNQIEIYYYETFEVGEQIIKSELLKFTTGKDYSNLLTELQTELDNNSPTPITPKANWGEFNRLCATSQSIAQILSTTTNQFAALRLQLIASPAGYSLNGLAKADYPLFQGAWGLVVDGLPIPPTVEMVVELNAIVTAADMDFSFNDQGKIEIAI